LSASSKKKNLPQKLNDEDITRPVSADGYIELYADYLSLYYKARRRGRWRTAAAEKPDLRRDAKALVPALVFQFTCFATQRIPANIATLVPLPKSIKTELCFWNTDEMKRMWDTVASGVKLVPRQAAFHKLTRVRDFCDCHAFFWERAYALSECVGIDLEDVDFHTQRAAGYP